MKSNNKNILLLLMLYTCVLPVKGQNVYTLDECIEAALQNNVRIKNADNDLKMAEHDKKEAYSMLSSKAFHSFNIIFNIFKFIIIHKVCLWVV